MAKAKLRRSTTNRELNQLWSAIDAAAAKAPKLVLDKPLVQGQKITRTTGSTRLRQRRGRTKK